MHTTVKIPNPAESTRPDQFIPVRKEDLFSALIRQGDLANPGQRELFWRFARTPSHDRWIHPPTDPR